MQLTGATALVTGANRGIGRALVEQLADRPLRRILAGVRDPAAFEPVSGGAEVVPVRMDLSSRASIDACAEALGPVFGGVDLLVNNAGQMTGGLLEEQDMDAVYAMFQVNLLAVAQLTHLALPSMLARRQGMIVNNASISGYAYFPGATTYAASKAGTVALSESLRRELRGTGVSVLTVITPGVDTDMLDATEAVYGRHMDTSGWDRVSPAAWAAKVVKAIESGDSELSPGGKTGLAKLASRGPSGLMDAFTARAFSRQPRP
jgi:short-subunit dehydrogenase